MGCHHPFRAFWTGRYTDTGKKEYYIVTQPVDVVSVFQVEKRFHVTPSAPSVIIDGKSFLSDPLLIPCGSCVGCRMQRAKQWKVRLCHEAEFFKDRCWFVTLTYDDKHLPINKAGEPYLNKRDLQLFLKRLRRYSDRKFRYFACGEYGENTARPHFHLILFGDLDDGLPFAFNRLHSELLAKCWPNGLHEFTPAEHGSMAYVAGYVEKKQKDDKWDDYPVKPFIVMSRKPAIGSNYVPKLDGTDNHVYGNFGKQHYCSIPRAYLKKCEDSSWFEGFKARQLEKAKEQQALPQAIYGTKSYERIGELQDEASNRSLEKVRKVTL